MISAEQIMAEARTYLGTPYHHIGRLKGVGVDCIGLVHGVAKSLGVTQHDLGVYSRRPDGVTLCREFRKCLIEITPEQACVADVPVFWWSHANMPTHAGIFTDVGLIHTYTGVGKVVEHVFDWFWAKRCCHVFRYPGVIPGRKVQWPPSR